MKTAIAAIVFLAALSLPAAAQETEKVGTRCHAWGPRKTCEPENSLVFPVLFPSTPNKKVLMGVVGSRYGKRCNPVESSKGHCVPDFHLGLDVKVSTGVPVLSVRDNGVVEEITPINNCLVVLYRWTMEGDAVSQRVKYCHLSRIDYAVGGVIPHAGDVIGAVGAVGHVQGPHLHVEMEVPAGHLTDWQRTHCIGDPPAEVVQTDYKEVRFKTFDPSCYGYKLAWHPNAAHAP